ncbi:SOS response-associated peptidase [Corynebacterium aquatimens]|uniref:SOS response-associated peptidase n=1 Tax=Corynebacterium TaxID=1716 RepID=UPI001F2091AC|nr:MULTISPECIES: SOS response-associated peptidase [Corynebacterium]QYH20140.1 SOS response-associated peptidase [Corynebacterium aquatimens]UIZ92628.1 SOS response-associated peptidase [Corynebacterium sp. CNCTC7651]
MCGRFVLFTSGQDLFDEVAGLPGVGSVVAPDGTPPPRYNIAPTQQVPLVRFDGTEAHLNPARWGLLPAWKKDETGPPLFNARGETVAEKPSFRSAFKSRRALMVLDGYYEWLATDDGKQPYYVAPESGLLYAAALWDTGLSRLSTTMVTTAAPEETAWLHHRLPLFLAQDEIRQWVDGSPEDAAELLTPSRVAGTLRWQEADKAVGNVRNDYAELMSAN